MDKVNKEMNDELKKVIQLMSSLNIGHKKTLNTCYADYFEQRAGEFKQIERQMRLLINKFGSKAKDFGEISDVNKNSEECWFNVTYTLDIILDEGFEINGRHTFKTEWKQWNDQKPSKTKTKSATRSYDNFCDFILKGDDKGTTTTGYGMTNSEGCSTENVKSSTIGGDPVKAGKSPKINSDTTKFEKSSNSVGGTVKLAKPSTSVSDTATVEKSSNSVGDTVTLAKPSTFVSGTKKIEKSSNSVVDTVKPGTSSSSVGGSEMVGKSVSDTVKLVKYVKIEKSETDPSPIEIDAPPIEFDPLPIEIDESVIEGCSSPSIRFRIQEVVWYETPPHYYNCSLPAQLRTKRPISALMTNSGISTANDDSNPPEVKRMRFSATDNIHV